MLKNKGFTLIELLVVISIIGLLSSIVLASVNGAKRKAQAMAIHQSFIQLRNAIELYRLSNSGQLPGTLGIISSDINGNSGFANGANSLVSLVTQKFISKIPHAPNWVNNVIFLEYDRYDVPSLTMPDYYVGCGNVKIGDYALVVGYDDGTDQSVIDFLKLMNMPHFSYYYPDGNGQYQYDGDLENYYCITNQ